MKENKDLQNSQAEKIKRAYMAVVAVTAEAWGVQSPDLICCRRKQADRAYQAHHLGCPTCTAAGKGHGQRCGDGSALWSAYEAAPIPEFGNKHKRNKTAFNQKKNVEATHV